MKYISVFLLIITLLLSHTLLAQSNKFPSSGNVGIGTLSPLVPLHIKGDVRFERQDVGGNNFFSIHSTSAGTYLTSDDPSSNQKSLFIRVSPTNNSPFDRHMYLQAGKDENGSFLTRMVVRGNGNIGVGIETPTHKLEVNGTIRAKEIKLEATNWPDYVFEKGYDLMSLEEIKVHIDQNGHLPGVKSAKEYEAEGVNIMELNQKLLEKIEELTLHIINQHSVIGNQKEKLAEEHEMNIDQGRRIDTLEMELREFRKSFGN
jgi:hypothetical protein